MTESTINNDANLDQADDLDTTPEAPHEAPVEDAAETPGDDAAKAARREAAKYRVQAKEARQEADELAASRNELLTQVIMSTVKGKFHDSEDLFRFAGDVSHFLDETGQKIDLDRLDEAVANLLAERPYLKAPEPYRAPKGRPKMPVGVPRASSPQRKPNSLEQAFGGGSEVKFADLVSRRPDITSMASASTVKGRAKVELGQEK